MTSILPPTRLVTCSGPGFIPPQKAHVADRHLARYSMLWEIRNSNGYIVRFLTTAPHEPKHRRIDYDLVFAFPYRFTAIDIGPRYSLAKLEQWCQLNREAIIAMINAKFNPFSDKNYVAQRWAVLIQKDDFFMDRWGWEAMPFLSETMLGDSPLGGANCRSYEEAKKMAERELLKRGIKEAILLGPDNIKEDPSSL